MGGESVPVPGATLREAGEGWCGGHGEQYQWFETPQYIYRVFVTNMDGPGHTLVAFYAQRAGAENLIKQANQASQQ